MDTTERGIRVRVHFGALAQPLKDQLVNAHIDSELLSHFQHDADAITRLAVRGLLSDTEINRSRQRLMKKIIKAIK